MFEQLIGPITGLLEKVIPDLDERNRLAYEISTLAQRQSHEISKAQLDVNKAEADHASVFVSGWRPATGWVCVLGFAFNFIIGPFLNFYLVLSGSTVVMPTLDTSEMLPVLLGMLGLGGLRTMEKTKKVARD